MSDLSYDEAEREALARRAARHGADYSDPAAIAVLSDQLVYLRNNPADVQEPEEIDNLTLMVGWDCDSEAAIILGRLRQRGWRLRLLGSDA